LIPSTQAPGTGWHALSAEKVVRELAADASRGLSEAEAAARLAREGPNVLPAARGPGAWRILFAQFRSLIIWVLLAAAGISALLGEVVDAVAIVSIVILNAGIGFYQEFNAEKSIAALRKATAPSARVRREGRLRTVPAAQVVRGDVIEFESGDVIPADARLFGASDLQCVEAALTGESAAVVKDISALPDGDLPLGDRRNMVFTGTSVAAGSGRAVVVATGKDSELGRIAILIEAASEDETTPLQKRLDSLGQSLAWISLAIVAVLFLLGRLRGMEPYHLFLTSISLAVAAAPEGLPAVVTVALALGVQRMARRRALVRTLPSVETLGSATVICTDKTGTLTAGEMTVRELYMAGETFQVEGHDLDPEGEVRFEGKALAGDRLLELRNLAGGLSATATAEVHHQEGRWTVSGDPTEGALITVARKLGADPGKSSILQAYPFDSDRKRTSVVRREPDGSVRILVNGAPDVLLGLCNRVLTSEGVRTLDPAWRRVLLDANASMAGRGLRVIASASREWSYPSGPEASRLPAADLERDLVFSGLAGLSDPPRPEARDAVARCRQAGIRVVMITGDHPATAQAVARELGLLDGSRGVITGQEMASLDTASLRERVESTAIYARVSAEHKLRIVDAWKSRGAVVAMTGDGVNDAPALKGAHIGVAMGRTGTEVTKQAADMIVADDNFATIVAAVEEGRGIYRNIRNTLQFLLGGNAGELLFLTASILAGLPLPLLAVHLLWINLVTDGLPALCLASERIDPDVMDRQPRRQSDLLSDPRFRATLLLTGALTAGTAMAVFLWALDGHSLEEARSFAFATLVFAELIRSFGARSEDKPAWRLDPRANLKLFAVAGASVLVQVGAHHVPLLQSLLRTAPMDPWEWAAILVVSTLPFAVLEFLKLLRHGNTSRRPSGRKGS
jgi:Ca2+-transporting ATPase